MEYDKHIQKLLEKADQLKAEGTHEAAIKVCEKIVAMDLNCVEAFEEIGDNYISLRELDKAEKALMHALSLDPESANAYYLLGFMHSCERAWKKSITFLEKADEYRPNHPEVLRCLGWSLFHSGEKERGVILLERAKTLAPNDTFILTDLGVCYLNEKQIEDALEVFRKVLAIDPDNKKARDCLLVVEEYAAASRKVDS